MEKKITASEIDEIKDRLFTKHFSMTDKEITSLEDDFIDGVRLYKIQNPDDVKTVDRWRKWYSKTRDYLHRRYPTKETLSMLGYIFETFTVEKNTERGMRQLKNWYDGKVVSSGYSLSKDTIGRINAVIGKYGYDFKEILQKC